jgi:hypothetical protein
VPTVPVHIHRSTARRRVRHAQQTAQVLEFRRSHRIHRAQPERAAAVPDGAALMQAREAVATVPQRAEASSDYPARQASRPQTDRPRRKDRSRQPNPVQQAHAEAVPAAFASVRAVRVPEAKTVLALAKAHAEQMSAAAAEKPQALPA